MRTGGEGRGAEGRGSRVGFNMTGVVACFPSCPGSLVHSQQRLHLQDDCCIN